MVLSRPPVYPRTVPDLVELVADFNEMSFAALQAAVLGPDAFDVDQKRCERLARDLGSDPESTEALLGLLAYMYETVNPVGRPPATTEQLHAIVSELVAEDDDRPTRQRIERLLTPSPHLNGHLRVRDAKAGYSSQARRFSVAIDLRSMPTTDGDDSGTLVPLVHLRVSTEQADGSQGLMVLQLDTKSLEGLDEAVRFARDRLDRLRANPRLVVLQG